MQLSCRVAVVICCLVLFGRPAAAQSSDDRRGSASLRVYSDDDHMTVITPSAGAQTPASDALSFDVNVTADIISGASVDVISEASPSAISETRLEGGLGLTWRPHPLLSLRTRTNVSHEPDYLSLRIQLGANIELAKRNTTLDLDYIGGDDQVGHVVDSTFERSRSLHQLSATLTQIASERTYIDLVAEARRMSGYHASPYRTVPIIDPASTAFMRVAETTPSIRHAGALLVRVRGAIDARARLALHLSYRFYADSWRVRSHTAIVKGLVRAAKRVQLGLTLRGYTQSAADFYQPTYELDNGSVPELRTRERRLGRMRSLFAGNTVDIALTKRGSEGPRLIVAAALMRFWWPDFHLQSERTAASFTLGAASIF